MNKNLPSFLGTMLFFLAAKAQSPAEKLYQEGLAKQNKGDISGAMLAFTSAIQANPEYILSYNQRALLKLH